MAYDPKTGNYVDEDASVSKKLTGLLASDNPYMQQAETAGLRQANRRGLLNSSMGVQAAEASRVSAALPIAQQEASQFHDRNIQGRSLQMTDIGQQRDITSQQTMQGRDIASREKMQVVDNEATRERLQMELGSRTKLQEAELAAEKERLGMQLSQQERLAIEELRAAEKRLGMELTSREGMQADDIASREGMHADELAANERIANMNLSGNERDAAARMAQTIESTYTQGVTAIMNNPEIPAAARQEYMNHLARIRDSSYAMIEQFYGIDIQWNGGTGGTTTPPGGPSTPPGGTPIPGGTPPGPSTPPNGPRRDEDRRRDR